MITTSYRSFLIQQALSPERSARAEALQKSDLQARLEAAPVQPPINKKGREQGHALQGELRRMQIMQNAWTSGDQCAPGELDTGHTTLLGSPDETFEVYPKPSTREPDGITNAQYAEMLDEVYGEGNWELLDESGCKLAEDDPRAREMMHALLIVGQTDQASLQAGQEPTFEGHSVNLKIKNGVGEDSYLVTKGNGKAVAQPSTAHEVLPSGKRQDVEAKITELEDRYKVDIEHGSAQWSMDELQALEQTLASLSEAELEVMKGVKIVREEQLTERDPEVAGLYQHNEDGSGTILIEDDAFQAADGGLDTISHEIGHRIQAVNDEALEAFNEVNKDIPLTVYGEETMSEGEMFAEAFMLYKTNPDFLKMMAKDLYDFFEGGGHLKP